jgi:hypothetical protein
LDAAPLVGIGVKERALAILYLQWTGQLALRQTPYR